MHGRRGFLAAEPIEFTQGEYLALFPWQQSECPVQQLGPPVVVMLGIGDRRQLTPTRLFGQRFQRLQLRRLIHAATPLVMHRVPRDGV